MQRPPTPATSRERLLDRGELRVMQAYLRMLGYYGDPARVRGVDVVDGALGNRTEEAIARFARDHRGSHAHPCHDLLDDVRDAYRARFRSERGEGRPYVALDQAFRAYYPRGGELWRHLHPVMRFPLLSALDDLRRQGVGVTLMDGRRSTGEQEEHIREGRSTAPPGASFHDYGLAIDVVPRSDSTNPRNPAWAAIQRTMERYGFYSLFRAQGWDRPHFELPAATVAMMGWNRDAQGWKQIPAASIPVPWQRINTQSLSRLSAFDMDEIAPPMPTPGHGRGSAAVQRA